MPRSFCHRLRFYQGGKVARPGQKEGGVSADVANRQAKVGFVVLLPNPRRLSNLPDSPPTPDPIRHDAYAALRIPDYRRFLTMRLLMTMSTQIMSVSVGYFVYDLTGDPLKLGLIGLVEAIPAIGVSLWAGHLADKYNRRDLLVACVGVFLLCSAALVALLVFRQHFSTFGLLSAIYAVIFCTGLARGFFSPINFAFLPQLVDKERLSNAISWNSSTWEVASITGLGLGGLLYGFAGPKVAFLTMTFLCAVALAALLRIASRPVPPTDHHESALTRIRAGLRFVFNHQLIIGSIALDMFAVLLGGAVALLPVFAKDILQVGPQGLGILRAAMSVGAIATALVLAHYPLNWHAGKWMLGAVAGFGLCIIGFGLSQWFWLSFFFLLLAGVCDEVSVFVRASLIQLRTPDEMKGRVSSVNSIFITSSNELGAFESGLMASLMGTVPSVVFGGCMTLAVVAVAWWKAPKLRDFHFG